MKLDISEIGFWQTEILQRRTGTQIPYELNVYLRMFYCQRHQVWKQLSGPTNRHCRRPLERQDWQPEFKKKQQKKQNQIHI